MSIWNILTQSGHGLLKYAADKLQFQLPAEPAPAGWRYIVARNVPLASGLSAPDLDRLLRVARLLIEEVPFEGCAGLEVGDEIRVTIAATAALLVHRLPYPRFTKLVRVLVYPNTFVPLRAASRHDMTVTESEPSLGQAWSSGVVILSWAAVQRDGVPDATGNVVVHEMAHILDAEDGMLDGAPVFDVSSQAAEWAGVLKRDFARQQDAVDAGDDAPLDAYAARNEAEFFAVAAEAYFCAPQRLRSRLPELFEQLRRFLRDVRPAVAR